MDDNKRDENLINEFQGDGFVMKSSGEDSAKDYKDNKNDKATPMYYYKKYERENPRMYAFETENSNASWQDASQFESKSESASCHGTCDFADELTDASARENGKRKKKKSKKPFVITKKFFVASLITAMVATSALTVGGLELYNRSGISGSKSISNYQLTSSEETYSWESIIDKTKDSVVSITTEGVARDSWMQNYVTQGAGSGVIISEDGYILTCNHVIANAAKITITLNDNKSYEAKIVGTDVNNDIALLKINTSGLTAATYGDSSKLTVGSSVVAIGNPLGELGGTATTGIISAKDRELSIRGKTLNLLQTDASINPGNSGGGLFDASGNLVGIVVAKSTGSTVEGLGFAIPINKAAEVAKELINGGSSNSDSTPQIGITITDIDQATAQANNLPSAGVYVVKVTSKDAQKAGLKEGDLIYSVEKTKISSASELKSVLSKYKSGDKVSVTVIRDNEAETIKVKLS